MEGDLGPLQALAQRRWPYPVSLKGEVNGQSASVTTKMRVEDHTVNFDELQIGTDHGTVKGQLALTPSEPHSKLTFKLAATTFAWTDLPLARKLAGAKGAVAHGKFVFNDEALDFGALQSSDADGDVSIDTLLLPEDRRLENVRVNSPCATEGSTHRCCKRRRSAAPRGDDSRSTPRRRTIPP